MHIYIYTYIHIYIYAYIHMAAPLETLVFLVPPNLFGVSDFFIPIFIPCFHTFWQV